MAKRIVLNNAKTTTLEGVYNEFINHCKAKGLAPKTIAFYSENIGYFLELIDKDSLCSEIGLETVERYTLYVQSKAYSNSSIRTKIRAIRTFLYFCMEREHIKSFKIQLPKEQEVVKETYTSEEIKRLLKKPSKKSFAEYRNYTAISLMLATGARVNTVINLRIEDIDLDNSYIIFRVTKNKKAQIMPMSTTLKETIRAYLRLWEHKQEDYLFCSIYGEKMTTSGFTHEIAKYNISRGVTKTSCHLFRHTFSKHYVMSGGDIFRLQKLLGHSTLDMVKKYVNLYGNDLMTNFDSYNVLEQHTQSRVKMI